MNESLAQQIKQVIDVISLLQSREFRFREELTFFESSWNEEEDSLKKTTLIFLKDCDPTTIKRSYLLEALRRLDHEVMFLCIDVFSLYQGVQKKKSLYASLIKNHGKAFTKVDKRKIDSDTVVDLGVFSSNAWRESSNEEKKDFIQLFNDEALKDREEMRGNVGPKSHDHSDMDEWMDAFSESVTVEKIKRYRKKFAHRLDTLDNLKEELMVNSPDTIKDMLDTIRDFLDKYQSRFQEILGYTTSEYYEGIITEYISLSQMKGSK